MSFCRSCSSHIALALALLVSPALAENAPHDVPDDVPVDTETFPGTVSASASGNRAVSDWEGIARASSRVLIVQHGFRMLTEKGTRSEMKGPFIRDYLHSVRRIRGWGDSDPFLVNYIGHPMMGSVTNFIYVRHSPGGHEIEIGKSRNYWTKALRAMAFSAAYSTQFELGPVSEASLGNVGLDYRTM